MALLKVVSVVIWRYCREWKTQQCQVKNLGVTVFRFSVFVQILTVPSALTTD